MKKYSEDIFNSCARELECWGYHYILDKENGFINFKAMFDALIEEFDCSLEVGEKNFILSVKLPIYFDESKMDAVSSYLLDKNDNPMFAHFILDYDAKEICCVYAAFCDGKEMESNILSDAVDSIVAFFQAFYADLVNVVVK